MALGEPFSLNDVSSVFTACIVVILFPTLPDESCDMIILIGADYKPSLTASQNVTNAIEKYP